MVALFSWHLTGAIGSRLLFFGYLFRLETPSKGGMKGQVPLDWTAAENSGG